MKTNFLEIIRILRAHVRDPRSIEARYTLPDAIGMIARMHLVREAEGA